MHRWVVGVIMAISLNRANHVRADSYVWPSYDTAPGPGGFATVTLESPTHASAVRGPNLTIRLRTDNPRAAVQVKLDGRHIDRNCKPFISRTDNPYDHPQWDFKLEKDLAIDTPVCGVATGLHVLEIVRGSFGSSLPATNDQRISFVVE